MPESRNSLSALPADVAVPLLENVPVAIYVGEFDHASTLRYVSPQITALTGRTPQELLADDQEWYRCIHPEDVPRVRAREIEAFEQEREFDCEFRFLHRDGRVFHVRERDYIVRDVAGRPIYTQGVVMDVTSLRQAEAAVRAERDKAQSYLDVAGTVMVAIGADHRITMLNRAGHELLGYEDGELIGRDYFDTCLPERNRHLRTPFDERLVADTFLERYETELLCRDGSERLVDWHTEALRDDDGRPIGLLCSGLDITESRRAQEQIAHMAYHDSLTGLPNRAMLRDHLELALARAQRNGHSVALLYLDLDDFKLVNDALGHAAGDELLRKMAVRLRGRLREQDLIAREGGDEFLILLADLADRAEERAVAVGESLVEALREPLELDGTEFEVNGSVGISLFSRDAPDAEHLLAHADTAMYEAKAAGRGCVRVFEGRRRRSSERLSLSRRLRSALEHHELLLHWQPIIDLGTGLLKGAEALVRWDDPLRGQLVAGEFVPDMERAGLAEQLDEWVATELTAQRVRWNAGGLDPYVGFNLSPSALSATRVERVIACLAGSGLALDRVTVELSESEALRDDLAARAALHRIIETGMTLALDDFGVAYSSLARLRDVPTKWIKIDKSFLSGVPERPSSTRVLDAMLHLLDALEVRVIVEGVETAAQVDHLRARACEAAQGYYLCPPLAAAELDDLLRASPESQLEVTALPRSAELRG
jgi:diguanylate cyclase (GGDEF)-like protein/PAS domain S-box-containing protein